LTNYLATKEQNAYLKQAYSADFSKNPFETAMESVSLLRNEPVVAGIQYIKAQLQKQSCSLSQRNIVTIVSYFRPDFSALFSSQLIQNTNKTPSLVIDKATAFKACQKFNECFPPNTYKADGDIWNMCEKFFTNWYAEGLKEKTRSQAIDTVQMGEDKYWNSSLEDSPYDVMYDISAVSKVLFESVQAPVEMAFYHYPNFSASQGGKGVAGGQ
jgi:hypothetical protein